MNGEPLKRYVERERCSCQHPDCDAYGKTAIFYRKDWVEDAIKWFKQYCDSGKTIFSNDFPEKYREYEDQGIKEKWDIDSDESWNSWLLDKAFPKFVYNRKTKTKRE